MACALCVLPACNQKETDDDDDYTPAETVAVTGFSLNPDLRVMRNLDSVFFSIDLNAGVIFNADSLPKGTNVTKLVPNIKYPNTVTSAVIEMTGGKHREGTVNYFKNPSDTIDFTGKVTLTLGGANDLTKSYLLKVNVHKEDPDTFYWDRVSSSHLPSRLENPLEQKTVKNGSGLLSLIRESDNSLTLSITTDIFEAEWNKTHLSLPFVPTISSLTAYDGTLFILSTGGDLYKSTNGATWSSTGKNWSNIIGGYDGDLMGITGVSGTLNYTFLNTSHADGKLPDEFPVEGYSEPFEISSKWTSYPTMTITGGRLKSGANTGATWAFDGSSWAMISDRPLPALYSPAVMPYYAYLKSASNSTLKEFRVLLAFGGKKEDGTVNDLMYMSYDFGISWMEAPENLALPTSIIPTYGGDAIPVELTMRSNLSDRWKVNSAPRHVTFEIDGDIVSWECPYIFLFGGYDSEGTLREEVYCGVLKRLTFTPLF